jgi:hypothetical protein
VSNEVWGQSMRHLLLIAFALWRTADAFAQGIEPSEAVANAESGRDTRRVMIAVAGTMFASYPMSIEDPGPALVLGKPLWLGTRQRFFQWVLDGNLLAGFGTASKHAHIAVTPQFGFNLYLGSTFGFELRIGAAGILQAGENVPSPGSASPAPAATSSGSGTMTVVDSSY